MPYHNQVTLVGNVVRDPSVKNVQNGGIVAHLTLGLTRRWTTDAGERKEEATFVEVDSFGKVAAVVEKYVRKGDPILVDGRLRFDQWEDKQTGNKRNKLSVVANGIQMLSKPEKQGDGASAQARPSAPTQQPSNTEEDSVPF